MKILSIEKAIDLVKEGNQIREQVNLNLTGMETISDYDLVQKQLPVFLEQLKAYKDAEQQGLLLKLPCKVGDYVYQLDRTNKKILTQKVQDITLYMGRKSFSMQIVFETTGMCFQREFGRTVFLNKKEAMQALKEISSRGST